GQGRAVAFDSSGNVLVAGNYAGTVDFGGGPTFNGQPAIFVVKYSPAGSYVWSRVFGITNPYNPYASNTSANGVSVDSAGNVLVTGGFADTVNLGGGPLVCTGNTDVFIAKFSGANGAHLWSRRVGSSPGWNNAGKGVAVDSGGNVAVTGTFGGTADFGTG